MWGSIPNRHSVRPIATKNLLITYNSVHVAEEGVLDGVVVVLNGVHEVEDHPADPLLLGRERVAHHRDRADEEEEDRDAVQDATLELFLTIMKQLFH